MMDKVIVIVAKGKGRERPDFITPKLFDDIDKANKFIEDVNDLDGKYWTYAEVVDEGEELEPWYGHF